MKEKLSQSDEDIGFSQGAELTRAKYQPQFDQPSGSRHLRGSTPNEKIPSF